MNNTHACVRIATFLLFLYWMPRTASAQFQYRDLKSGKIQIKKVLILPPEATLVKSGMKGAQPLVSESQAFQLGLSSVVRETLAAKGCDVLSGVFSDSEENSRLKYALADLQAHYDNLQPLLRKRGKDVTKGRFSVGDEVANFSPGTAADGLVFVRATGILPTAGLKTFVVLTGMGYTRNYAKVDISIVDAQSGMVLYLTKANVYGGFVDKPDTMKDAIDKSFAELVVPRAR